MLVFIVLIALFPLGQGAESYRIEVIDHMDDSPSSPAQPLGLVHFKDALFVVDTNFHMWSLDASAQQARLLGKHTGVAFRALYPRRENLLLLDQMGFRSTYFDQLGQSKGSVITRTEVFYEDQNNRVSLHAPSETATSPIEIHWKRGDSTVTYPFSDKPSHAHIAVAATGTELLLASDYLGEISYAVLDLKGGGLLQQGTLPLPAEHHRESDSPLGITAHPTYGFTLTQYAGGEGLFLHQFTPASKQWRRIRLTLAPNEKLLFCHRLEENLWIAHTGIQLQRFRLIPIAGN